MAVEAVDSDRITMRQMVDADRETGERRYAENTMIYNVGRTSADLAYAVDGSTDRAGKPTSPTRSPATPRKAGRWPRESP